MATADWNDIHREYMETRYEIADMSEEEARARRELEQLEQRREQDARRVGGWNDNTTTVPWGTPIAEGVTPYYTYSSPGYVQVDPEQIKQCVRDVLKEFFREDPCFMAWLKAKYNDVTIPVLEPERGEQDAVHTRRTGPQPGEVRAGGAGAYIGSTSLEASLGGVSLRSDVQSEQPERNTSPDQGSREYGNY